MESSSGPTILSSGMFLMASRIIVAFAVLTTGSLWACRGDGSAGAPPPTFELGPPSLVIGSDDSLPGQNLYRISGLFRTGDGHIVVANGGSGQIRIFEGTGSLVAEMGGSGPGPEEFQALRGVLPFGRDSVIAWDPLSSRFAVWSLGGQFGRTIPVNSGRALEVNGELSDGRLVLSSWHQFLPRSSSSVVLGRGYSDTIEVVILDVVQRTSHRVGFFLGRQVVATKNRFS